MLLPLVLLMILALGYFTKAEGSWENAFHCAADESARSAAMAYDGISDKAAGARIRRRVSSDVQGLSSYDLRSVRYGASDRTSDHLTSYILETTSDLKLPAGFSNIFRFSARVKYRNFVGRNYGGDPLGTAGLENNMPEDPVWIFPQSGEKYHSKNCTYVKATVHSRILNSSVRARYSACSACRSGDLSAGSVVWCFEGDDTAYHRGICRTINRHTAVIDRTEAIDKGYTPCSKCGGK